MIKVIDEPSLVRNNQGVILNNDNNEYHSFIAKRNSILKNEARLQKLESDSQEIKNTLAAILGILRDDHK